MVFVILFGKILSPGFEITKYFANAATAAVRTGKFIYQERYLIVKNKVFIWEII